MIKELQITQEILDEAKKWHTAPSGYTCQSISSSHCPIALALVAEGYSAADANKFNVCGTRLDGEDDWFAPTQGAKDLMDQFDNHILDPETSPMPEPCTITLEKKEVD